MTTRILVIDDDRSMCELIQESLQRNGWHVAWRTQGDEGLELMREESFDVVITDVNLENMSGHDLCRNLTENRPDTPVIVITAFGNMSSAISAIRAGAYDFINKPIDMAQLAHVIDRAVQHRHLREEVKRLRQEKSGSEAGMGGLGGESRAMLKVYDLIRRVASTDTTVLLTGESGTGKELVARALHTESARAAQPFVAINCAAVPGSLLESELFGHVKGAFTDAKATRKGMFEQASGGTLLLDEIGEMPLEMQPKLLRVLQERQVRPVGGNVVVPVDARIIAATNRDLESEVEEQRFREDLYYRLNVVQIHVPPLRARGNDVLLLAQHFVRKFADRMRKGVTGISSEAAKKLVEYDWPGNVRQLENSMERAVTLTRFEQITVEDLPDRISRYESSRMTIADVDSEHMLTLDQLEKRYIERVLKAAQGNKTQAAKLLGVDRRTLYRKLERYEGATD
ncbi:MAG TPA: sigma-54 dependent transcriptional regulator [Polyangiaceae bacterium]|nr:sigma-54 dependent transcriptional regulator [Polyangiaceae bacterium]